MAPTRSGPPEDVRAAWAADVARRVQELDADAVETLSRAEARRMILCPDDDAVDD